MRESTPSSVADPALSRRAVVLVLAAIVVVLAAALWLGGRADPGAEEAFGGTDAAATEQLEAAGHQPWFQPVMPPAGGEIESGLFALQAGLGGIALGYAFGRLRGRPARTPVPAETS